LDADRQSWVAAKDQAFGQGRLAIRLNRSELPADLALTLIYEETPDSDFVVQLWDDQGRIVAVDLFSNIITAGREAKTDTFIIALGEYPTATQIVLRRLTGEVRIYGFVLSPVACEVPVVSCDSQELALQLGNQLNPANPLVIEANRIARVQLKELAWSGHSVQQPVDPSAANEFARIALANPDYPEFSPSSAPLSGQVMLPLSATALLALQSCARLLNAFQPGAIVELPTGLSSADSLRSLMEGITPVALMSIPMTVGERERFFRLRGYHITEAPVALDPIQIYVHPENPIRKVTIPELDAIFGTELRAGGERLLRVWGDLGLGGDWQDRSIVTWGGTLVTGTARIFSKLVLQDGPFRSDLKNDELRRYLGVLEHVALDHGAIGFSNAQHQHPGVKRLAVASHTGRPAYDPNPENVYGGRYPLTRALYLYIDLSPANRLDPVVKEYLNLIFSRQGQERFALGNQAPLPADEVIKTRKKLGL
jgi:phosphate transport system substrate-binding protein